MKKIKQIKFKTTWKCKKCKRVSNISYSPWHDDVVVCDHCGRLYKVKMF